MRLPIKNKAYQLLEQYCDGYNRRDLTFLSSLFTQECNVWGSGPDEYRVGINALEMQHQRDWAQSEKGEIQIVSYISPPDDAPWAAMIGRAIITIGGVVHQFDHLRGTITLAQENGLWKIAHMHASFPDFRNAPGGSFPQV